MLHTSQTVVVKVGTASLIDPQTGCLDLCCMEKLVETLAILRYQGQRPVLVTSGAVGIGCVRLGRESPPQTRELKQAVSAVGQGHLIRMYSELFAAKNQEIAQVLVSYDDLGNTDRPSNTCQVFRELMQLGIIPVVNENDATARQDKRFESNDTLSAEIAKLLDADWLFLMTDVDMLYSADPKRHPDARPIAFVSRDQYLEEMACLESNSSSWGTGGMGSKVSAARVAASSGVKTVIMSGKHPQSISKVLQGHNIGTFFEAGPKQSSESKVYECTAI